MLYGAKIKTAQNNAEGAQLSPTYHTFYPMLAEQILLLCVGPGALL